MKDKEEMAEISVKATHREKTGKSATQKLRVLGQIPAILYGKGKENTPVSVDPGQLKAALTAGGGINALLSLEIEGLKSTKRIAIVKEIQKDPIHHRYTHVDFFELDLTKAVTVDVPLHFVGKAEGIAQGGIVQPILREVRVKCLPHKIPKHIEVDVTPLKVGDALHMSNLKAEEGYEIIFEHDDTVVTVAVPKEEAAPAPSPAAAEVAVEGAPAAEKTEPAAGAAQGPSAATTATPVTQAKKEGSKSEGKK